MTHLEKEECFNQMLDNVYLQLEEKIVKSTSKLSIPVPVIEMSTTNTYWKNIKKILQTINRPGEHFITYLQKELKNWIMI
jgi:translation initiation factor 2 beta subunit (eIF-2beta)/eIF-5